jgi:hypothetical protein
MLENYNNPTKGSLAQFLSLSTGRSYESTYMDLTAPEIKPISSRKSDDNSLPKGMVEFPKSFDYSSLIGKYNGLPSKSQVIGYMMDGTACSYESVLTKLNRSSFSNDVKVIGGVKLRPVKMIHGI